MIAVCDWCASPATSCVSMGMIIAKLRRCLVWLPTMGALRFVQPVLLSPRLRLGDAVEKSETTLEYGADRADSQVAEVAKAEVADIAAGTMLRPFGWGVFVRRKTVRHQAGENACSAKDHDQDERNDQAECQTHYPGYDHVPDSQGNGRCDDAGAQGSFPILFDAERKAIKEIDGIFVGSRR